MSIVASGSVREFFVEVVEDAMRARKVPAPSGATSYLVSLLADYARPDGRAGEAMERPLAFLLDEALHAAPAGERFDRLRALGDAVLYTCGFFGDHLEARGVDQSYVVGIGSTAYGAASSMLGGPRARDSRDTQREDDGTDIFGELAVNFVRYVEVIEEVADATIAHGAATPQGVLKIYERWLRTGSGRLAETLSAQGVVPRRGGPAKGILH